MLTPPPPLVSPQPLTPYAEVPVSEFESLMDSELKPDIWEDMQSEIKAKEDERQIAIQDDPDLKIFVDILQYVKDHSVKLEGPNEVLLRESVLTLLKIWKHRDAIMEICQAEFEKNPDVKLDLGKLEPVGWQVDKLQPLPARYAEGHESIQQKVLKIAPQVVLHHGFEQHLLHEESHTLAELVKMINLWLVLKEDSEKEDFIKAIADRGGPCMQGLHTSLFDFVETHTSYKGCLDS